MNLMVLSRLWGTYGNVFEGFDDFDRAIESVEDFIRLVKDPRVNGYVGRLRPTRF